MQIVFCREVWLILDNSVVLCGEL